MWITLYLNSEEYKASQKSVLTIIGYSKNEETNDDELITDFIADSINTSLELSEVLEWIKRKIRG